MIPRQWWVHEVRGGGLALVVQSDLLPEMGTRVIVPVLPADRAPGVGERLAPVVASGEGPLRAMVPSLTVLPVAVLGGAVHDASGAADRVARAIDMLLGGV